MKVATKRFLTTAAAVTIAAAFAIKVAQAAESIVGTWRLLSFSDTFPDSKDVAKTFGENPNGLITFTADGRMSMLFTTADRSKSAGPRATDAEAAKLYSTMAAYAGSYKVEGDKLMYKIEVSWNQNWNGTDAVRIISFPDGKLQFQTPPGFVSPTLGKPLTSTLVWERVK